MCPRQKQRTTTQKAVHNAVLVVAIPVACVVLPPILLWDAAAAPVVKKVRLEYRQRKEEKAAKKRHKEILSRPEIRARVNRPVAPKLRKSISVTSLSVDETATQQITDDQQESLFFTKLPLEIRRHIYRQAFGAERPVHVIRQTDAFKPNQTRLAFVRCANSSLDNVICDDTCWRCVAVGGAYAARDQRDSLWAQWNLPASSLRSQFQVTDGSILPVLQSCRRM